MCITQLTSIFQMNNAKCYKITRCIQGARKTNGYYYVRVKKIDMISDSTLQLSLRNYYLFWHIKEEYSKLSENNIKIFLPFPTTHLCKAKLSSYVQPKQHIATN